MNHFIQKLQFRPHKFTHTPLRIFVKKNFHRSLHQKMFGSCLIGQICSTRRLLGECKTILMKAGPRLLPQTFTHFTAALICTYSCCQKLHQHESSVLFLASESESVSQPLPSDLRRDCHRSANGRDKGQRPDHLSEMAFTLLGFGFRSFKIFRSSLTLLAK